MSDTPTPTTVEELTEIVRNHFRSAWQDGFGCATNPKYRQRDEMHTRMVMEAINALRRADMEAVIGDDWYCETYENEPDKYDTCIWCGDPYFRHKGLLQRERMKERLNG